MTARLTTCPRRPAWREDERPNRRARPCVARARRRASMPRRDRERSASERQDRPQEATEWSGSPLSISQSPSEAPSLRSRLTLNSSRSERRTSETRPFRRSKHGVDELRLHGSGHHVSLARHFRLQCKNRRRNHWLKGAFTMPLRHCAYSFGGSGMMRKEKFPPAGSAVAGILLPASFSAETRKNNT